MLPVVMRGATAFATETMDANEKGVSLGEAAKGALKPALQAAVQAVAEGFKGSVGKQQEGAGKRRKRKSSKRRISKSGSGTVKQKGKGKRKAAAKRVYKGKRTISGNQLGGTSNVKKPGKSGKRSKSAKTKSNF